MGTKRIICLVADGFGVGEAPDASLYNDVGSNTLVHVAEKVNGLKMPNLERLGLGCLANVPGVPPVNEPLALVSRMAEKSSGKDTTTGHWEIAGLITREPFALFPQGFPESLVQPFVKEAGLPGVLGNQAASGTAIIETLGEEHCRTLKPILYTSGDSVFQLAAHEEKFGLERLYQICRIARKLTLSHSIGRVIARPFLGEKRGSFKRTENRRDYALAPPENCLDRLTKGGIRTFGVGKIEDIFDHRGLSKSEHTGNNRDGLRVTLDFLKSAQGKNAFIFTNLVDFDQNFGHRRDPVGYAKCLEEMDAYFPEILKELGPDDTLILTSDHGCDPTFKGTDHTREFVPLVAYSPGRKGKRLADRSSFADISASILKSFGIPPLAGTDFL